MSKTLSTESAKETSLHSVPPLQEKVADFSPFIPPKPHSTALETARSLHSEHSTHCAYVLPQDDEGKPFPWASVGKLPRLRHLDFSQSPDLTQMPVEMCDLKDLRSIAVDWSGLTTLPDCEFPSLAWFGGQALRSLESFPLFMLKSPKLQTIDMWPDMHMSRSEGGRAQSIAGLRLVSYHIGHVPFQFLR